MGKVSFVLVPPKPTTRPHTTMQTTTTTPRTTTPRYAPPLTRAPSVCELFGNQHCDQLCVDDPVKRTFTCECYEGYERKGGRCVMKIKHVGYD